MGKTFNKFIGDISALKVRKDEDVSFTGDFASGSLFLTYGLDKGCIGLKFTLEHEFRGHLLCHFCGTYNLIHHWMLCTAHRRKTQEGYFRLHSDNILHGV